jgi:hypothetical protein
MVAAIGTLDTSANSTPLTGQAASAGLQAQIASMQKELSDCVNCASATTLKGAAHIAELANRISVARERLSEAAQAPSPSAAVLQINAVARRDSGTALGNRLDAFA